MLKNNLNDKIEPIESSKVRKFWQKCFSDLPIRHKQLLGLFTSEVISIIGLVGIGSYLIITGGRQQLVNQAKSELTVAEINYNIKIDQMGFGFRGQSDNQAIIATALAYDRDRQVDRNLKNQVKKILQNEIKARDIEYATLVGIDRKIIVNANAPRSGELFDPNELVSRVLATSEQIKSTQIVEIAELKAENPPLPQYFQNQNALIRYTLTPVKDPETNNIIAVLISGDIVNQKPEIVEKTVRSFDGSIAAIYQIETKERIVLSAASQNNLPKNQVSTQFFNLISQKEEFKSLLSQPEQIVSFRIDSSGRPCSLIPLPTVYDCYTVVAKTLFSYEGEPVAIVLMGNSEKKMQIQLNYSLQQQSLVSILALLVDIILALLLGRAIVKPIENLQLTTQKFSNGNRQIRARVLSNDEIGQLTYHFNQMAQTIEAKEVELAEKSRQLEIHNLQLQLEIAERKKVEQKLEYNSLHDSLTGLANRVLFMERLSFAIAKLKRYPQIQHAVLFLDLDRFKPINDTLGHYYGDLLLIELASRLKNCLREIDTLARLGGDEFTILLEDLQDPEDAAIIARRINNEVAKPFYLCEQKVETTVSIGIAITESETLYSPEQLLRHADLAMYHAKNNGKNSYVIFDSTIAETAVQLTNIESDLKLALEDAQFYLHYQPIVCLHNNKITGFEALLRWQHPERGLISPSEFIPIAEETDLIVPIGYWAIEQVCRQIAIWRDSVDFSQFSISINLSAQQLKENNFSTKLTHIIRETQIDPSYLRLEITESLLLDNLELASIKLETLKKIGLKIYLDDFGTGYSSLSCLHRLPISGLKIDRSFIQNMTLETQGLEIVRTILNLAENLDIKAIAEGVETPNQLKQLKNLNCDFAQGYLFSPPVDRDRATELILNNLNI